MRNAFAANPMRRKLVLSGAAGLALGACGGGSMHGSVVPTSGQFVPLGTPWRTLPPLRNDATVTNAFVGSLVAGPSTVSLIPGVATAVWAYNDTSPGPLIAAEEGDTVRLRLLNRLAQDTTIHWHGMPVPADQDGNPMDPVAPGAARDYAFTLPAGSAGSYWYHPHPHRTTHEQVFRGLASAFVVRSPNDPLAALPERIVFVTDLRLDANGQIAANTATDFEIGREGDQLLVNGVRQPIDAVTPGRTERWRIYNATNARYLLIALDGAAMTLVALDGSMRSAPAVASTLLLAPAQRADVVVQAPSSSGRTMTLRTLPYSRGFGIAAARGELLFELSTTNDAPVNPFPLPAALPSPPPVGAPQRTQSVVLADMGMGGGMGMGGFLTINGRTFDPARDDLTMRAGVPEEWIVRNDGSMDHPLHIHGCAFQLVASTHPGVGADPRLGAFMDTVNVRPGETLRVRLRIDSTGRRMFHCHILEHEDQGMMGVVNVTP